MKSKAILFDLECTNLKANFGYILAIGWKELDKPKVYCPTITDFSRFKTDPTNDKDLIRYAVKELSKADLLIGHYSVKFDMCYIQSRLLYHGLPPMPPIPHVDTWRIARYKMALNSNRLDSIAKFLGVTHQKTALSGPQWIKAAAGHKPSIRYIKNHCIQDVLVLEEVYNKIKPLMTTHPNVSLVEEAGSGCPTCGEHKLQKRGFTIARTRKYQRWQCQACGGWSRSSRAEDFKATIS